ncbi:MAG: glycosyltransferase [Nitrososphaerales archaeon]
MVSVIVPTKDCRKTISNLLVSLHDQKYPHYEVIVVDSSNDGTDKIASEYDSVKVIRSPPMGPNLARNLGLKNAQGEIVSFIDGDCVAERDWIDLIVKEFNKDESVGCVGGSVLIDGSAFLGEYMDNTLFTIYPKYSQGGVLTDKDFQDHPFGKMRVPVGCNMAFRRNVLEELGGFRIRWRCPYDEIELFYRILHQGYKININPKILVHNIPRPSFLEMLRQVYLYGMGAGNFLRTYRLSIEKRVLGGAKGLFNTILHSLRRYRNSRRSITLLYPFVDVLVGATYFVGLVRSYFGGYYPEIKNFDLDTVLGLKEGHVS